MPSPAKIMPTKASAVPLLHADQEEAQCVEQQPQLQHTPIAVAVGDGAEEGGKEAHCAAHAQHAAENDHVGAEAKGDDLQERVEDLGACIDQQFAADARADQARKAEFLPLLRAFVDGQCLLNSLICEG